MKANTAIQEGVLLDTILDNGAMLAVTSLDTKRSINAIQHMYDDAFLYGRHADTSDYNAYTSNDRDMIFHIYSQFKALVGRLSKYDFQMSGSNVISAEDYALLDDFIMQAFGKEPLLSILEDMMITSLCFKYRITREVPTDEIDIEGIHFTYMALRDIIKGYIPEPDRKLVLTET